MSNLETDVLLVGGGIMSATLGVLLNQLDPSLHIMMVEQLEDVALESSDALNNAGTGHAGYCELNYTPQEANGSIAIQRALEINAAFEVSLQFWAYLVESNALPAPNHFINKTPHLSFVGGEKNSASSSIIYLNRCNLVTILHNCKVGCRSLCQTGARANTYRQLMLKLALMLTLAH